MGPYALILEASGAFPFERASKKKRNNPSRCERFLAGIGLAGLIPLWAISWAVEKPVDNIVNNYPLHLKF
ncbi:hypothetical protein J2Y68_002287 [Paenarthrobacter nitroguajacolicus]|nr:hypothetical protein [Paenarthrobacter nitroguajacolicus]